MKNLQSKIGSTEKICEKFTTKTFSLRKKINSCAEEKGENEKKLKNVTNKVKC